MSIRKLSSIILGICLLALAAAYAIEQHYLVSPCPLCSLQRFVYACIAATCLVGIIVKLSRFWVYAYYALLLGFAVIGQALSAWQVWLQYFAPPQTSSCAAGIQRLIELYPLFEALKLAISGSAECASVDFTILGLSIAVWSFGVFTLISLTTLYLIRRQSLS